MQVQGEEHRAGRDLSLRVQGADGARGHRDEAGDQAEHRRKTINCNLYSMLDSLSISKGSVFQSPGELVAQTARLYLYGPLNSPSHDL